VDVPGNTRINLSDSKMYKEVVVVATEVMIPYKDEGTEVIPPYKAVGFSEMSTNS